MSLREAIDRHAALVCADELAHREGLFHTLDSERARIIAELAESVAGSTAAHLASEAEGQPMLRSVLESIYLSRDTLPGQEAEKRRPARYEPRANGTAGGGSSIRIARKAARFARPPIGGLQHRPV